MNSSRKPYLSHFSHVTASVLIFAYFGTAGRSADDHDRASQRALVEMLHTECIRYRQEHMHSGRLELHVKREKFTESVPRIVEEENLVWFSDDRIRFDFRHREGAEAEWGAWSRVVVDNAKYMWIPPDMIGGTIAQLTDYKDVHAHFGVFHPRVLGLGVSSVQTLHRDSNMQLLGPHRTEEPVEVESVRLRDQDAWRLVYQIKRPPKSSAAESGAAQSAGVGVRGIEQPFLPSQRPDPKDSSRNSAVENPATDGKKGRPTPQRGEINMPIATPAVDDPEVVLWIIPEEGYSLARAEMRTNAAGIGPTLTAMEATYKRFPHRDIWYPEQVSRTVHMNGELTFRETLTVGNAEFGEAIDDGVFELAAMDLPKNKRIFDRTEGGTEKTLVWDGKAAVHLPNPVEQAEAASLMEPKGWGMTMLFLVNAVLLSAIGCWCVVRLFGRRASGR